MQKSAQQSAEWRDIPGYEGLYQISSAGRVKRLGGTPRRRYERYLRPLSHSSGYRQSCLSMNGVVKRYLIHQLVMLAFIGEANGLWVNHKNGNKADNRLENLEYVTPGENNKHAYRTGLRAKLYGRKNGRGKLTDEDIYLIECSWKYARDMVGSRRDIAKVFGVSQTTVTNIINRTGRFQED
jgi:NUMOD4 motif-containing protein/HNH endonuclease